MCYGQGSPAPCLCVVASFFNQPHNKLACSDTVGPFGTTRPHPSYAQNHTWLPLPLYVLVGSKVSCVGLCVGMHPNNCAASRVSPFHHIRTLVDSPALPPLACFQACSVLGLTQQVLLSFSSDTGITLWPVPVHHSSSSSSSSRRPQPESFYDGLMPRPPSRLWPVRR